MPLSEEEKVRIRDHLSYLNSAELATFALGVPAGVETQQLIERGFLFIKESALPMVRSILCELDELDVQRRQVRLAITAAAVGGIQLRDPSEALTVLAREFVRLIGRLSNAFGVPSNPFDNRKTPFGIPVV